MRPNQPLTVKVKASLKNGTVPKQVNVLVSAVDSGVLNITDYVTPDPWEAFFGQKRYGADIYDIYGQVIEGQGVLPRYVLVVMVTNSTAAASHRLTMSPSLPSRRSRLRWMTRVKARLRCRWRL
jgi:hypothetical protein